MILKCLFKHFIFPEFDHNLYEHDTFKVVYWDIWIVKTAHKFQKIYMLQSPTTKLKKSMAA